MHALRERLWELLKERDWTQTDLAKRADVSQAHVSRLLSGQTEDSADVWIRLLTRAGEPPLEAVRLVATTRHVVPASSLPAGARREPLTPPASVAVVEDVDADDLVGRALGRDVDELPVGIPVGLLHLKSLLGDSLLDDEFAYLYGFADPSVRDHGAQRADRWTVDDWWKVLRHLRECRMLGRDPDLPDE